MTVLEGDQLEDFDKMVTECMAEILDECIRRGMVRPFIITSASKNGSVLAIRATYDGTDPEVLAEGYEEEGFALPIRVMVIDQTDRVVFVTFTGKEDITYH